MINLLRRLLGVQSPAQVFEKLGVDLVCSYRPIMQGVEGVTELVVKWPLAEGYGWSTCPEWVMRCVEGTADASELDRKSVV